MIIEQIVRDYLAEQLGDVPVYCETPENKPAGAYVIVEKTAHSRDSHIDRATIALQSISPASLYEAAALSGAVVEAAHGLVELVNISRARLDNEYNFTDSRRKEYRYQAVFNIVYMN